MSMHWKALVAAVGFMLGATLVPASACEWMKNKDTTAEAPASTVSAQANMTPTPHGASVQMVDQAGGAVALASDGATDVAAMVDIRTDPVAN